MRDWQLLVESPAWLLLLIVSVVPLVWMMRCSLAALSGWQRWLAAALRLVIVALVVMALAEPHWNEVVDRVSVVFLIDQSGSVSPQVRERALEYVREASTQRLPDKEDVAGLIVFGGDAVLEHPPMASAIELPRVTSLVDQYHSNLAGAMDLVAAALPANSARRVVLLTDGNENQGSAKIAANLLADRGIGIDTVELASSARGDVSVDKIIVPPQVRRETPFDLTISLERRVNSKNAAAGPVEGRLQLIRKSSADEKLIAEERLSLDVGRKVLQVREQLDESNFYTYEARFIPDDPKLDSFTANNGASAFTQVRGRGQILLIENREQLGMFSSLVDKLRQAGMEVTVQSTAELFTSLAELQRFDTVILANVPRTSGESESQLAEFTDAQLAMLKQNTEQLGCGLVMIGGPESFGAGGWTGTAVEEAMPVDFQIKNAKVVPAGALMLVIDSSGSMEGDKIDLSRSAAIAAAKMLGPSDYLGVISFDSQERILQPLMKMSQPHRTVANINKLAAGGGTNMMPAMQEGYRQLKKSTAAVKHMIVLTDGQTEGSGYPQLAARMKAENITVTAVAIGSDSAKPLLADIAASGGGKFYDVVNPRIVPRIFMRETRRVVRPLVFEDPAGFSPQITMPHEMLDGIDGPFPPITGYVLTTVKENPLVEVLVRSPKHDAANNTLVATWTFGLGRTVVLTTDAGQRWSSSWNSWADRDKFFVQMIRSSMRPIAGSDNMTLATDVKDGRIRLTVTALDEKNELLNSLDFRSQGIGPDEKPRDFVMRQVAPGRYVGEIDADQPGNYLLQMIPGQGRAPLRAGVHVSAAAEFKQLEPNRPLLTTLASTQPRGGEVGEMIGTIRAEVSPVGLLSTNVFRRTLAKSASSEPLWPWLLLAAAALFWGDVLLRRLQFSTITLARPNRAAAATGAPISPALERLRARKAEVNAVLSAKSFAEPQEGERMPDDDPRSREIASGENTRTQAITSVAEESPSEVSTESYAARLREAKRNATRKS